MTAPARARPSWVALAALPAVNLTVALALSAVVVLLVGENPLRALRVLASGAFGDAESIGYTLYYATNFVFTGLAVAVAFHASLFNIGAEGQAYIGGLGVALLCLGAGAWPQLLVIPAAVVVAAAAGAAWAFLPGWLQARRGSHVVITTIMFNFLAAALMVYLMVNVLIAPGLMSPESREFGPAAYLPQMHEVLVPLGVKLTATPLNLSVALAAALCVFVWLLLWHTPFGFELRTAGHSAAAAVYAGVRPRRVVMISMCLSGAIAGCVGLNEIMGVHHRLLLNFTAGYGFAGIAVALMGRNHPVGIVLAGLLFGILSQGGTELAFAMPAITRDMIVVIQGLVILFSGALPQLSRPGFEWLFAVLSRRAPALWNA